MSLTRETQRKWDAKLSQTAKDHGQKLNKKTSSKNCNTDCVRKSDTDVKKKNKKKQTPAKNIFQRKVHSFHTEKVGVNTRKTKQYSEAGQASPKHVANRATKKFGYNF